MNKLASPIGTVREGQEPKVTVRIIGRCNFRCPYCSTFSHPDRKDILSFPQLKEIIALLADENFRGVLNISGGESTLHPNLADMVEWASLGLKQATIVVFTNGDWVGSPGWPERLDSLRRGTNVLIRFSLDRQHAQGKFRSLINPSPKKSIGEIERERLDKARVFMEACLERKAKPGLNFDFAYKGNLGEAKRYMRPLGDVPIYPLEFQKDPARRPKRPGMMAVDFDSGGRPRVYLTLGHIPRGEALGGIPALPLALKMNRDALRTSI